MILKEFSNYLKEHKDKNAVNLLNDWIIERIKRPSRSKIDNILRAELYYAENENHTFIIAKSDTGRTLMNALYNFSLSFENYKAAKFLHSKNSDIKS